MFPGAKVVDPRDVVRSLNIPDRVDKPQEQEVRIAKDRWRVWEGERFLPSRFRSKTDSVDRRHPS